LPFGYPALRRRFAGGKKLAGAQTGFPPVSQNVHSASAASQGRGSQRLADVSLKLLLDDLTPESAAERRDFNPEKKDV
jgi:hypothetical protein